MGKRKVKKQITVTIVNPEAIPQASVNFTKALFKVFVMENIELENQKKGTINYT